MKAFKVIDTETGREASADKIEKIAKESGLMETGIDQFFIGEDGRLVLADDCGNIAHCDAEKLGFMPVSEGKYPDLEYLESVFLGDMRRHRPEAFESILPPRAELVCMFPQTWPNTAGGFSRPGTFSGQAFTTKITTVLRACGHNAKKPYYGVFFGNRPAYIINGDNEHFLRDLKSCSLKSAYKAQEAYQCLAVLEA